MKDFREETRVLSPHLIVGCCFADLFDPHQITSSIMHLIGYFSRGENFSSCDTLIYFPITFSGTTQFYPPKPFALQENIEVIPSDTTVFGLYGKSLVN